MMVRRFSQFVLVVLATLLLSCSTDPGLDERDATWKFHGLDSVDVRNIYARNGKLYAGTDRGVYISTDPERTTWRSPKLDIEGIQYLSLAMEDGQKIIAAVHYYPDYVKKENPVFFKSTDDGKSWQVINETTKGLTRYGDPVSFFLSLGLLEQQTSKLKVLFGYSGVISRSTDGGKNWEVVYDKGGQSKAYIVFAFLNSRLRLSIPQLPRMVHKRASEWRWDAACYIPTNMILNLISLHCSEV